MADTFENKKDKATLKAEKRAAIKAARDAAKKAAGKEVRVLSAEEKIYNSAVSVMEAADCVERFERVYISMLPLSLEKSQDILIPMREGQSVLRLLIKR